jgi:hypothetical protein
MLCTGEKVRYYIYITVFGKMGLCMETDRFESSRIFYREKVAVMIHDKFAEYEGRIAVGIAGEGSDCFGYDDFMSRDHDFGTGVCLWLTDEDMELFGDKLTSEYDRLAYTSGYSAISARLMERRGVMTIHDHYSNILGVDCDTAGCAMSDENWRRIDHACLATAVNGEVFRDDLGAFTRFRELLLAYYPESIYRERLADELHRFSAALQVNYARCMTRKDTVAAQMCRLEGLKAAMELFFLLKRVYPPYYKWTYRRLAELDVNGAFSAKIRSLAEAGCAVAFWKDRKYNPDRPNLADPVVNLAEQIAADIVIMLKNEGLIEGNDPYLERYVDRILAADREGID